MPSWGNLLERATRAPPAVLIIGQSVLQRPRTPLGCDGERPHFLGIVSELWGTALAQPGRHSGVFHGFQVCRGRSARRRVDRRRRGRRVPRRASTGVPDAASRGHPAGSSRAGGRRRAAGCGDRSRCSAAGTTPGEDCRQPGKSDCRRPGHEDCQRPGEEKLRTPGDTPGRRVSAFRGIGPASARCHLPHAKRRRSRITTQGCRLEAAGCTAVDGNLEAGKRAGARYVARSGISA